MKNNKNKILAAVICGMVIGSIGTSVVGNFQSKNVSVAGNSVAQSTTGSTSSASSTAGSNSSYEGGKRGGRGQGKGGHHGEASLETTTGVDVAAGSYTDGTYEGTADGFGKNLKVEVTINSGKISDIQITSHNETPGFYEGAFESVPASIIEKQSTSVDTVSGATYSSVGIINAVNNALANA